MDIKEYIVQRNATLLEAMNIINKNSRGIVYVCDGRRLIGALSDGNVRRHILEGGSLDETAENVSNKSPKCVHKNSNINISNYMRESNVIEQLGADFINVQEIKTEANSKQLLKDEQSIEKIKCLLDSIKKLQEFVKILIQEDRTGEKDVKFYSELIPYYDELKEIIPLYNKTRNYLTQKPYSTEKVKLNFECPTLLDGWDVNKEEANLGVVLLKDEKYYLGIINPYCKKIFKTEQKDSNRENSYKKMDYKLLPGPNKMFPKVFFSKTRIC